MSKMRKRPWHPDQRQRWEVRQDELDRLVQSNPDVHGCVEEYGVGQPDYERDFSHDELRQLGK